MISLVIYFHLIASLQGINSFLVYANKIGPNSKMLALAIADILPQIFEWLSELVRHELSDVYD